jgi:glycosyltransferase involved in cell wall biosynthesis
MTDTPRVSIILPVHNQTDHIEAILKGYQTVLNRVMNDYELILVLNGCTDDSPAVCRKISESDSRIRVIESAQPGWGKAIRAGLAAAKGQLLCYTNSARTSAADLTLLVLYGIANPGTVIKANRKKRASFLRRLGSLLYNLQCRSLFDLSVWDINGTPKVFDQDLHKRLELKSEDDLIDLEFNIKCRNLNLPVVEVPIFATSRHGGRSTTNLKSAFRLYAGAFRIRREMRAGNVSTSGKESS